MRCVVERHAMICVDDFGTSYQRLYNKLTPLLYSQDVGLGYSPLDLCEVF